jgi:hypothetical protein
LAWINDNFLYNPDEEEATVTSGHLHVAYLSLRTNSPVIISIEPGNNGKVPIVYSKLQSLCKKSKN